MLSSSVTCTPPICLPWYIQ